MKYSNVIVLKELKNINKCLNQTYLKEEGNENIRKCIYGNNNSGILNYLIENQFLNLNTLEDGNIIPFISPYGSDFLKRSLISCFIEDHIFNIIGVIGAIGAIFTILSYFK